MNLLNGCENMKAEILEAERLVLKPLSFKHCTEKYLSWLNDEEIYRYLETNGGYTMDLLRSYLAEVVEKDIFFWAIHIKENDKHIGNIKIDPINVRHNYAEYGLMIGDKAEWGRGYAKEATVAIIDYCFNTLKIRKINLGVVADNSPAVKLYENLGFIREGVFKKQGFYNGKYCDTLRMAIFNPLFEYES